MTTTATKDLTPVQCQEHMDELLEMQSDEKTLRDQRDKAHEKYTDLKKQHEVKEGEIIKHIEGLNEEHPLFDDPVDVPWPFPLTCGEFRDATLANVAADTTVLGLSISVVKAVKEVLGAGTLGELEKYLKAETVLDVDAMTKGKRNLANRIGPAQALNLLRAVHSFTGGRTKTPAKKKAEGVDVTFSSPGMKDVTVTGEQLKKHAQANGKEMEKANA